MGGVVVANSAKRKGTQWESDVRRLLRGAGVDVESLRQLGSVDEGDLVVRCPGGVRLVLEAKNHAKIALPEFMRQADAESRLFAENRGLDASGVFGAAVVKARGAEAGDSYVVFRLSDLPRLAGLM